MEFGHILMFFMTFPITSTVSRSGDHVFIQTGGSVKLDIKNNIPQHFNRLFWMKDNENIVRFVNESGSINHDTYKESVDFNEKTLSLTLKNMQKTDNGLYVAKTIGEQIIIVAEHNISVLDPVDSPVLKLNFTMISVNACVVNVSCSGHDRTINDSYLSNNCTKEELTLFGIQNLTLYCIDNVVVCNYSNLVSWKNETFEINQICPSHEEENPNGNISSFPLHWLMIIAGVLLLVFIVVSIIGCSYKKRKKDAQQNDNTVYAHVQPRNEVHRPLEMLEKSANPQTVYGFTGEHKQTRKTSQTMPRPQMREQTQTENRPSTTYSTIGQHQKPSFASETDHTIYSIVSKSTHGRKPVHK